jgi:hypothetical protein
LEGHGESLIAVEPGREKIEKGFDLRRLYAPARPYCVKYRLRTIPIRKDPDQPPFRNIRRNP